MKKLKEKEIIELIKKNKDKFELHPMTRWAYTTQDWNKMIIVTDKRVTVFHWSFDKQSSVSGDYRFLVTNEIKNGY